MYRGDGQGSGGVPGNGYFSPAGSAAAAGLCARATAAARSVDLLWPAEQMSSLLAAVSRATGVGRAAPLRIAPEGVWWRKRAFAPHAASADAASAERLSRSNAPCDWALYELAQRRAADGSAPVPLGPQDVGAGKKRTELDWRG